MGHAVRMLMPFATAIVGAVLGAVMLLAGVGLALAVLSADPDSGQIALAALFIASGCVNLVMSFGVRTQRYTAILTSGIATAVLVLYLLLVVRDVGEPVVYHTIYLVLLLMLARRARHARIDAPGGEVVRS